MRFDYSFTISNSGMFPFQFDSSHYSATPKMILNTVPLFGNDSHELDPASAKHSRLPNSTPLPMSTAITVPTPHRSQWCVSCDPLTP